MAALSLILFLGSQIPALGAIAVLLCPVPLTLVWTRHGGRRAMLSFCCATILVTMIAGLPQAYIFILFFGLPALATGWMLSRDMPIGRALLIASMLLGLLSTPLLILVSRVVAGEMSLDQMIQGYLKALDQMAAMVPDGQLDMLVDIWKRSTVCTMIVPITPFLTASLMNLYLNHFVTVTVSKRMAFECKPLPNPYYFRLHPIATIGLLVSMRLMAAAGGRCSRSAARRSSSR